MKDSSNRINENEELVDDLTNECNLFALDAGLYATQLDKYGNGDRIIADKVRVLADRTVLINGEDLHKDRYDYIERTIVSLHDLAQISREFKDEVKRIK
jgi:hypothetical protein